MTEYYAAQLEQQMAMEMASVILTVVVMFFAAIVLWNLAMYVMEAVGLYTIARRRGLKNPWMAWVPVLNHWLLGCVSDQYRYVVKGEIRSRRVLLLVLAVASALISWVGSGVSMANSMKLADIMESGYVYGGLISGTVGTGILVGLAGTVVSIVLKVFRHMALYDVYTSCDPHNNVLYLVLGIIFDFLNPIFLFANRNKDEGMPPRREQPQYHPPVEEYAEV